MTHLYSTIEEITDIGGYIVVAANNCQAPFLCNQPVSNRNTISRPKQWKPAPSTFSQKYITQLGCEASVMIADVSDQEDYFKGSSTVLAVGLAGNSLTLGLAGDALIGTAVISDAVHARRTCVPLAWGP